MEHSKRRRRDADYPRISYHTSTRHFDRLFQEKSLAEMKEVVQRKLNLDSCTSIVLAQIRDEERIDLEDDDDFDAFYALAHSTHSVDVEVTVIEQEDKPPRPPSAIMVGSQTKLSRKKRKRDKEATPEDDDGQLDSNPVVEDVQTSAAPVDAVGGPQKKKRKTASVNIEVGEGQSIFSARKKSNVENSDIVQVLRAPLDDSDGPRKKKQKKASGNVSKAGVTSRSAVDLPHPSTASTSLLERATERVPALIQIAERGKSKKQKQKTQTSEAESTSPTAVDEQAAMTKVQPNTQKVDFKEVEQDRLGKKKDIDISKVDTKKTKKVTKMLTPDERKALAAELDMIYPKVIAAKLAARAASVNVIFPENGDIMSSSKTKKKKKVVSQSPESLHLDPLPADVGPQPSQNVAEHSKSSSEADCPRPTSTCPLCQLSPSHEKMACPLVLGGPESLRERIQELQEGSEDGQGDRAWIISELHGLLRLAEETPKPGVEPPVDSHDSPEPHKAPIAIDSLTRDTSEETSSSKNNLPRHTNKMSTAQTMKTSDTGDLSDDESPNGDNEPSNISHDPGFLAQVNLDDLIRGPSSAAVRISDLESSDSSEEDAEEDPVLEEDEPEVQRRPRKSSGVLDSSDEADSGLDDTQSITEEPQESTHNDASQRELPSSSVTDHVSFQSVDRTGESQEVDRSADAAFGVALEMDTAILNPIDTPEDTSSEPATETRQSLAPSRANLAITPLDDISTFSVGPSATQPLVSTPLTTLRDTFAAQDTRDEVKSVVRKKPRNGKAPVNEKNLGTPTISQTLDTQSTQASQSVQDGVARRTRAATRRETLGTMTTPVPPAKPGKQSRLILPAFQTTEDLNVTSTTEDVMSLDTWATLRPSSPVLDADATIMVDELEPSSPSHHNHVSTQNSDGSEGSQDNPEDPLFLPTESLPPFPYSQWNGESQEETHKKSDVNNVETSVKVSRNKPKQSQNTRYRRLTDITSDHGFFSTPTNLRATRSSTAAKTMTDIYRRSRKDEIESESESDSDESDTREESHIPKSRRAGTKRK